MSPIARQCEACGTRRILLKDLFSPRFAYIPLVHRLNRNHLFKRAVRRRSGKGGLGRLRGHFCSLVEAWTNKKSWGKRAADG